MRQLFCILLAGLSLTCARASTVHFALTNFNITTATNQIIITPTNFPVSAAPWLEIGLPIRVPTVNGIARTNLLSGCYVLSVYNYTFQRPLIFCVPDDTNTYEITTLLTNGVSFSTTNPPFLTTTLGDTRYLPIPTNNSTATDGQVPSKTGDKTKWVTGSGGSFSGNANQFGTDASGNTILKSGALVTNTVFRNGTTLANPSASFVSPATGVGIIIGTASGNQVISNSVTLDKITFNDGLQFQKQGGNVATITETTSTGTVMATNFVGSFIGDGSAVTNLTILSSNILYVSKNGSDVVGTRNSLALPYLTITAAKNAAVAGDMIVVLPGVYTENNLLKPYVNYQFYPGASVNYTNTGITLASGLGIFDDRGTGPTTNSINGALKFYYSCGTNATAGYHGNTNAVGAVVLTNSATDLYMQFRTADGDIFQDADAYPINGSPASCALFAIYKCRRAEFHGSDILCSRIFDTPNGIANDQTGFYWEEGETYLLDVQHIAPFPVYGIWPNTRTDTIQNMWVTCQLCEGYVYASLTSAKNKCWYDFKELRVTNSSAGDAFAPIGGRHYLRAEKISANDANGYCIRSSNGAEVWATVQKMSAPDGGGWVSAIGSTNYVYALQLEAVGTLIGNGISSSGGGSNYLQYAFGGQFVFNNQNGTIFTNPLAANAFVSVTNGGIYANGQIRFGGGVGKMTTDGHYQSDPGSTAGNSNFVGGSIGNFLAPGVGSATIGGGHQNYQAASYGTIVGGFQNTNYAPYGTVAGSVNVLSNVAPGSVVAGHNNNVSQNISSSAAFTVFGEQNTVGSGITSGGPTISGGGLNYVNADYGTIIGGLGNTNKPVNNASASYATVAGGRQNLAGADYTFAAGRRAQSTNQGAFVLTDSQNADFPSTTTDQMALRFQNGVTNNGPLAASGNLTVGGGYFAPTNSSFAPDFNIGNSETNIGAAFTLSLPLNVVSGLKLAQTTVFIIRTNGSGSSPFALTAPTGVKFTGTPYVTNTTIVSVYAYGKEFTNYNFNPIY